MALKHFIWVSSKCKSPDLKYTLSKNTESRLVVQKVLLIIWLIDPNFLGYSLHMLKISLESNRATFILSLKLYYYLKGKHCTTYSVGFSTIFYTVGIWIPDLSSIWMVKCVWLLLGPLIKQWSEYLAELTIIWIIKFDPA